jgi:hypothetical protein
MLKLPKQTARRSSRWVLQKVLPLASQGIEDEAWARDRAAPQ